MIVPNIDFGVDEVGRRGLTLIAAVNIEWGYADVVQVVFVAVLRGLE